MVLTSGALQWGSATRSENVTEMSERKVSEPIRLTMIVNPISGKGKGAAAGVIAAERLRELGAEVSVRTGHSAEATRRLAVEALGERPSALVVVGGDGTLAAMIDDLAHTGTPIALVPAGTGNDFARALGIPCGSVTAAAAAAELVVHGRLRTVDVGEAVCPDGGAKFLTVAALGFDAYVSERTNRLRWPRGAARYYLALLIELARLRPLNFTMRIAGRPVERRPGILVAVGNTRNYGGGMPICPEADPSDGLLDITQIAAIGRLKLLRLFPLLLQAKHLARPEALSQRTTSIEISAPGLVVYADGERIGSGSVKIGVLPAALRVFVPEEER